jgi:hypothetical protein
VSGDARPLVIGLTGGIGSGKTAVANTFAAMGVPVTDTDALAHALTAPGTPGFQLVLEAFGTSFRRPDGTLDRAALRRLVVADASARTRLEWILHPVIRAAARRDSELILFLDGDCVPYRNWVATYRAHARPGEFLVGGYIFLSEQETLRLTPEAVRAGAHERPLDASTWWRLHSADWRNKLYAGRRRNRPRIRGGNFAVARDLFERVDGFDEEFAGFGKEDSELRNRMRNAGARGISLWTSALSCHLSKRVFPSAPRPQTPRDLYDESFSRIRARVGLSSHPRGTT